VCTKVATKSGTGLKRKESPCECQLLLRQIRKRFGPKVAGQSEPILERITEAQPLEGLGEALLDSPDGTTWLQILGDTAERTAPQPPDHP
jgi:hypothetical protein